MADETRWEQYYQAVQGRAPRPLFTAALAAFKAASFDPAGAQAVDLGCGDGTETLALLAVTPKQHWPRLQTQVASFQDVTLAPADFVYAGLSLPFCPPAHFPAVWAGIVAALRPDGRFAGHLFGERDSWRTKPGHDLYLLRLCELLGSRPRQEAA